MRGRCRARQVAREPTATGGSVRRRRTEGRQQQQTRVDRLCSFACLSAIVHVSLSVCRERAWVEVRLKQSRGGGSSHSHVHESGPTTARARAQRPSPRSGRSLVHPVQYRLSRCGAHLHARARLCSSRVSLVAPSVWPVGRWWCRRTADLPRPPHRLPPHTSPQMQRRATSHPHTRAVLNLAPLRRGIP